MEAPKALITHGFQTQEVITAARTARMASMPRSCRKNYETALRGKSPRAAIKAQCLDCMGWDRAEVRACTSPACPLYPYRPFQE